MKAKCILQAFVLIVFTFVISCDIQKENPADSNTAPPSQIVLSGTLIDDGGNAVTGATITVGSFSQTTNSSGTFYFGIDLVDGSYSLTGSKTGYYTITRKVAIKKDSPKNLALSIFKKSPGVVVNAATGGTVGPLSIPANSLSATTEISVTNILGAGIPNQSGGNLILAAFALEPNGLIFQSASSLQITNPLSGINPSIIKAQSVGSLGTEELNVSASGNSMSVPINHFSEIYYYIPSSNFRYSVVDDIKIVETTIIASCNDKEKQLDVTLTPQIVMLNLISQSTVEAMQGNLSSITVTLKISRALTEPLKQLTYQQNNKHYILEINDGNSWKKVAEIIYPEVTVIPKNVGPCHDQGSVSG